MDDTSLDPLLGARKSIQTAETDTSPLLRRTSRARCTGSSACTTDRLELLGTSTRRLSGQSRRYESMTLWDVLVLPLLRNGPSRLAVVLVVVR